MFIFFFVSWEGIVVVKCFLSENIHYMRFCDVKTYYCTSAYAKNCRNAQPKCQKMTKKLKKYKVTNL